jgi:hypothetical protein
VKNRGLVVGGLGLLVLALSYCSFGPDEYTGPFPPDAAPEDDGGGSGGGGGGDDGGGMDDGGGTGDAKRAR